MKLFKIEMDGFKLWLTGIGVFIGLLLGIFLGSFL